jgi:AcrR family transcriptional regulator
MVRKAGLSEDLLVKAAVDLIDEEGIGSLSLARLAERLGVRSPSLYKHISGLEGLHQGIALWGVRELGRSMSRAAVGKSGDEAVMALAQAYRSFAKEHPGIMPLLIQAPDPTQHALEAASAEILTTIQAVLVPFGLAERELLHAIRGLRSVVHGFVALEAGGGFGLPVDIESSFRYLMESFIRGLRRPATDGAAAL